MLYTLVFGGRTWCTRAGGRALGLPDAASITNAAATGEEEKEEEEAEEVGED